jgi:hypothetical protein
MPLTAPKHAARLNVPHRSALAAAWAVVIVAGSITMTYNIWHATHAGHMLIGLALFYGIGPVTLAALLSHVVAEYDCGWVMKGIVFGAMIGAMGMSIGATAWVIGPTAGPVLRWLFGAVLDVATLAALRVILDFRTRKQAAATALETAHAEAERATREAGNLVVERDALRARLVSVQAELGSQLETVQAELETVRGELVAALQARTSDRKRARSSGPKRRMSSGPNKTSSSGPKQSVPSDVDTQAEALTILAAEPDISGGELGRRLGKSERYGCMLKNRLAGAVTGPGGVND